MTQAPAVSGSPRCPRCTERLRCVLDLGEQPLANALLERPNAPVERYPLRLGMCGSGHVQLMDPAPPTALFSQYVFRTGASEPARRHFETLAVALSDALPAGAAVCEVGSNDGTLLHAMRGHGLRPYGVDPSSVAAEVPGTEHRWFTVETARELRERRGVPDAVVMCNVLAHCPDPTEPIAAAKDLLAPGGLLVIEAPYLYDLLERLAWDTIYHEHVHYLRVADFFDLLLGGFAITKIERLPVHGGSVRIWARRVVNTRSEPWCPELRQFLMDECPPWRIDWLKWERRVRWHQGWLRRQCEGVEVLAGYGCPAKATVMLNATGIRPLYVTDTTPGKWGKWIPGAGVQVFGPARLQTQPPDKVLLLAWNYAESIMAREPELAGKWIVPFGGL